MSCAETLRPLIETVMRDFMEETVFFECALRISRSFWVEMSIRYGKEGGGIDRAAGLQDQVFEQKVHLWDRNFDTRGIGTY